MPRKPPHFIQFIETRGGSSSNPSSTNSRTVPMTDYSSPPSQVSASPPTPPVSPNPQSPPTPQPPPNPQPPPVADEHPPQPPPLAVLERVNLLLRQDGHDNLRTLHPGPNPPPGTWWFAKDNKVSRSVTHCIKAYFTEPHANWTQTEQRIRDLWFESFAQKWHWDEVYTSTVHTAFVAKAIKRLAGTVSNMKKSWKILGNDAKPEPMDDAVWNGLVNYWIDPHSIKVSSSCSLARTKPDENGDPPTVHSSGQSSYARRIIDMAKGGELPPLGEVLRVTHKRKDGAFVDARSEKVYNDYTSRVAERESQLSSDGSSGLSLEEKDNIYKEIAPRKKNRMYGNGSISEGCASSAPRRTSSHTSSHYVLESELQKTKSDLENAKYDLASVMKLIVVIIVDSPSVREKMQEQALEREQRNAAEQARQEQEREEAAA